jgi:hypothetical protein
MDFPKQYGIKDSGEKARGRPRDRGNRAWPNRDATATDTVDLRFHSVGFST